MAEKQKQGTKRVKGFEQSQSVGSVWAWRLLRRSQMRANVFDMHFTRRTT